MSEFSGRMALDQVFYQVLYQLLELAFYGWATSGRLLSGARAVRASPLLTVQPPGRFQDAGVGLAGR